MTPLTEEPDATVPRVFEQLMRQRVAAGFLATIFGEEPATGRHTVHNAYRVTVVGALDSQPEDETNPFDAAEWYGPEQALAVLPTEQAALLKTALDLEAAGVIPSRPATLTRSSPRNRHWRPCPQRRRDGRARSVARSARNSSPK